MMTMKKLMKVLHDTVRQQHDENGVDVRGYKVILNAHTSPTRKEFLVTVDHEEHLVIVHD